MHTMEHISLEKRIEELTRQLRIAHEDWEEFRHALSHDLKAPLRAVQGFSLILKEDYGGALDEEANRIIDVIVANANKVKQQIEDLVNLSAMGAKQLDRKEVNMKLLVEECLKELLTDEQREGFEIFIGNINNCTGDTGLLKEVWLQLLKNAIRYSSKKEQPSIEVNYSSDTTAHIYSVKDKGEGFDMEYSHKLFKIFQRLHNYEEFEGAGTGLALVKRIVLRHGGSVWAEATPNKGSCFYFSIPF